MLPLYHVYATLRTPGFPFICVSQFIWQGLQLHNIVSKEDRKLSYLVSVFNHKCPLPNQNKYQHPYHDHKDMTPFRKSCHLRYLLCSHLHYLTCLEQNKLAKKSLMKWDSNVSPSSLYKTTTIHTYSNICIPTTTTTTRLFGFCLVFWGGFFGEDLALSPNMHF